MRLFGKHVRKQFRRVHEYMVGRKAERLLNEGCRLTFNTHAPSEYDLAKSCPSQEIDPNETGEIG